MKRILFILGTRPEVIKMALLIHRFQEVGQVKSMICFTGQHREMGKQTMEFFDLKPDYDLDVMVPNQSLSGLTANLLVGLERIVEEVGPDLVFVQGDTTSTFVGAVTAYYHKIKIAHLEAGLRSHNRYSPFPEEANRVLVSHVADYHFAPTERGRENLMREGISGDRIYVVGNTVIDALLWGLRKIESAQLSGALDELSDVDFSKRIVLVTGHRRESFGTAFLSICEAIREIAESEDVEVVYPVHLNPNVSRPVHSVLSGRRNVHLLPPISYPSMIYLMSRAYVILTDSGGVQEEAPSLMKPVLVMRDVTERPEGVEWGVSKLVGTQKDCIVRETLKLVQDRDEYKKMATGRNPYGDGTASLKIMKITERLMQVS
jgi:UDP-N-acetylglucosamine 2-epimerase (non-hydrolysing)